MSNEPRPPSLHIPIAILAAAFAVILAGQVSSTKQAAEISKWQIETGEKNFERMKTLETQNAEAFENRETMVKQSAELQNKLQALLDDLLKLAETDNDAKAIIQKWNVQRTEPKPEAKPPSETESGAAK